MQKQPPALQPDVIARLRAGVERLLNEGQRYAEIGIAALVREGGLARSTFYVYFEDKDELLRVLAADVMQDLVDFDGAWWTLPPDASKAQIHDALVAMFEAYNRHGALMAAIVDAAIYDAQMRRQSDALIDGAIRATAGFIREGKPAGIVPKSVDADRTAFWILWMLERGFSTLLTGADDETVARRTRAMTDVIWAAYRGDRAS